MDTSAVCELVTAADNIYIRLDNIFMQIALILPCPIVPVSTDALIKLCDCAEITESDLQEHILGVSSDIAGIHHVIFFLYGTKVVANK